MPTITINDKQFKRIHKIKTELEQLALSKKMPISSITWSVVIEKVLDRYE